MRVRILSSFVTMRVQQNQWRTISFLRGRAINSCMTSHSYANVCVNKLVLLFIFHWTTKGELLWLYSNQCSLVILLRLRKTILAMKYIWLHVSWLHQMLNHNGFLLATPCSDVTERRLLAKSMMRLHAVWSLLRTFCRPITKHHQIKRSFLWMGTVRIEKLGGVLLHIYRMITLRVSSLLTLIMFQHCVNNYSMVSRWWHIPVRSILLVLVVMGAELLNLLASSIWLLIAKILPVSTILWLQRRIVTMWWYWT